LDNIVLIGFMGAGKTVVGQYISKKINMPFIDLDQHIEAQQKQSISELFKSNGEAYFRELESSQLDLINAFNGVVVSTGGGIVETVTARDCLVKMNSVIWLRVKLETVLARINNFEAKNRPLFDDQLADRFNRRQYLYQSVANFTVDVDDLSIESVAETIINRYG
jgi:shikimate kinase